MSVQQLSNMIILSVSTLNFWFGLSKITFLQYPSLFAVFQTSKPTFFPLPIDLPNSPLNSSLINLADSYSRFIDLKKSQVYNVDGLEIEIMVFSVTKTNSFCVFLAQE